MPGHRPCSDTAAARTEFLRFAIPRGSRAQTCPAVLPELPCFPIHSSAQPCPAALLKFPLVPMSIGSPLLKHWKILWRAVLSSLCSLTPAPCCSTHSVPPGFSSQSMFWLHRGLIRENYSLRGPALMFCSYLHASLCLLSVILSTLENVGC